MKTSGNDRSWTGPSDAAFAWPRRVLRDGSSPPRRREAPGRPAPQPPPRRCLQGTSAAGLHRRAASRAASEISELSRKGRQTGRQRLAPCTCGTAQRCVVSPPQRGLARARPLRGSPRGCGRGVLGARPERGGYSDVHALGWVGLRVGHRGRRGEGRDPDHARGERFAGESVGPCSRGDAHRGTRRTPRRVAEIGEGSSSRGAAMRRRWRGRRKRRRTTEQQTVTGSARERPRRRRRGQ